MKMDVSLTEHSRKRSSSISLLDASETKKSKKNTGLETLEDDKSFYSDSLESESSFKTEYDPSINEPDPLEEVDDKLHILTDRLNNNNSGAVNLAHNETKGDLASVYGLDVKTISDSAPNETEIKSVFKNSIIFDAKIISSILPNVDFHTICDLLSNNSDREDKLDYVTSCLSETPESKSDGSNNIIEEVQLVIQQVPTADANEVFNILESLPPSSLRIKKCIEKLQNKINTTCYAETNSLPPVIQSNSTSVELHQHNIIEEVQQVIQQVQNADANEVFNILESLPPSSLRIEKCVEHIQNKINMAAKAEITNLPLVQKNTTTTEDLNLANDPLFRDMKHVVKMFPNKDQNEIYALLEAHYNKPDRIQIVVNEILLLENDGSQQPQIEIETMHPGSTIDDDVACDVEKIKMIFPDCDPNYLYERLVSMPDANRADILVAAMFEKKDYPKLKDLIEENKEQEKRRRVRELKITIEEFVQKFSDPVKTFSDITKNVSDLYKQHVTIFLKNEFPMLKASYLNEIIHKKNFHLYPSFKKVSTILKIPTEQSHNQYALSKKRHKLQMPIAVDEYFYHELWFIQNIQKVLDYPKEKENERKKKIEEAKEKGELYECCCCFDDECLFEELTSCPEGHLFCKTCVLRSTEAAFGEMKVIFPCLAGGCDENISLNTLQTVLPTQLFSKIVRRLQEEEVQKANIPDLVTCPFCPFATIMPNPDDKVLKCLNPDCLKESCRLCQEPNHVPLRCNEVEKRNETDMRLYIENQIAEAVMRKCHKCGKKFVKDSGCNKMTCVCGASSCYACKAINIDYSHFERNNYCANTDPEVIHQRDMQEAAKTAKKQYILEHPEAAEINLKTDIITLVKPDKKSRRSHNQFYHYNDVFFNYEHDDNVDNLSDDDLDDDDLAHQDEDDLDDEARPRHFRNLRNYFTDTFFNFMK